MHNVLIKSAYINRTIFVLFYFFDKFVMKNIDIAVLSKLIRFSNLISIAEAVVKAKLYAVVDGGGGDELGRVHVAQPHFPIFFPKLSRPCFFHKHRYIFKSFELTFVAPHTCCYVQQLVAGFKIEHIHPSGSENEMKLF